MRNAIGMVEFTSISRGIYAADQMVKTADVDIITAMSTCPGKYIAVVNGDVAAVQNSVEAGCTAGGEYLIDSMVIPNVDSGIFPALSGASMPEDLQAIGILECFSLAAMITTADAVLKSAELDAIELRLGNGLGGKGFFTFTGDVAAVQAGVDVGRAIAGEKGVLVNAEVIPSPSERVLSSLL
ncbi:MAG: BMC domain-containing protein [Desulfobacterales bacterium]|nr:BMC domain-containing protein [Desulfobacterales bacterium]